MGCLPFAAFPRLRSSHIAIDSSLSLKGRLYYSALTLKRVFIFFYTELILYHVRFLLFLDIFVLSNIFDSFGHYRIMSFLYWLTMIAGIVLIIWHFFQTRQYQEIKTERLAFDDKVFGEFKKQRESRRKKYTVMIIAGVVILLASSEIGSFIMIYFGQTACNVFEWASDAIWLALLIESRGKDKDE